MNTYRSDATNARPMHSAKAQSTPREGQASQQSSLDSYISLGTSQPSISPSQKAGAKGSPEPTNI